MKISPSRSEFKEMAASGGMIAVCCEIPNDQLTPVAAFFKLYTNEEIFLFESASGKPEESRYSFLGTDPFLSFRMSNSPDAKPTVNKTELLDHSFWSEDGVFLQSDDPFEALENILSTINVQHPAGLPRLIGGGVGYIGYDAIRHVEHLPNAPQDDRQPDLPDISMDFYDKVIVFDHFQNKIILSHHVLPLGGSSDAGVNGSLSEQRLDQLYDETCDKILKVIKEDLARERPVPLHDIPVDNKLRRGFDKTNIERSFQKTNLESASGTLSAEERFCAIVDKCKEYIFAGDIFQVVISQRFEIESTASPVAIYRALRYINPSPYMFFLRTGNATLVGSSPELMLRVEDGEMTLRPLAGTRKRGASEAEDDSIADELIHNEKERAEHVMLVDLGRNDIGRVAEFGSVKIPQQMEIERYSHVMHISSTVTGSLKDGKTSLDAMKSCLPAGTVSGAPKVRAMEIIDEFEPTRRGPYGGAIGFLDFNGNMETCLGLRTIVVSETKRSRPKNLDKPEENAGHNRIYLQAGAGIVADSDPRAEFIETINKSKAMLKAVEIAEKWKYPMADADTTVLSCIQPTRDMHIGNYFGAVKNWVELQHEHRCIYGVVDLHAMTKHFEPEALRRNSRQMFIDLLACGIDPDKSILFIQSMIPEHTELSWILSCFCSYGELSRMTQFKDKSQRVGSTSKDEFISAGLLTYPVLQAADILIYKANYVPVGKDQEQHLELSRSIARRFNQRFSQNIFPEPQPLFSETPKIMSLSEPDRKMSKSDENEKGCIGLFEDEASIRKKVKSAVTATATEGTMSPGVANLLEILQACGKNKQMESFQKDFEAGTIRYADLKGAVADALVEVTSELIKTRNEVESSKEEVDRRLKDMTEKTRALARETLRQVKEVVGLPVFE